MGDTSERRYIQEVPRMGKRLYRILYDVVSRDGLKDLRKEIDEVLNE